MIISINISDEAIKKLRNAQAKSIKNGGSPSASKIISELMESKL
jgi:hypothetical protein